MSESKPSTGPSLDSSSAASADSRMDHSLTDGERANDAASRPNSAADDVAADGACAGDGRDGGQPAGHTSAPAPEAQEKDASDSGDAAGTGPSQHDARTAAELALFLPGGELALSRAQEVLRHGKRAEKARLISLLLTYASWDEIWTVLNQEEVRKLFGHLDLPPNLHIAWARHLGIEVDGPAR